MVRIRIRNWILIRNSELQIQIQEDNKLCIHRRSGSTTLMKSQQRRKEDRIRITPSCLRWRWRTSWCPWRWESWAVAGGPGRRAARGSPTPPPSSGAASPPDSSRVHNTFQWGGSSMIQNHIWPFRKYFKDSVGFLSGIFSPNREDF